MAENICIKEGGSSSLEGNATPGDVLKGKTFYSNDAGEIQTGTFAPQEKTITSSVSAQTVTPDSGKYLSKVTVNALTMSGTYTFASGSTGGTVDLGANNTYRYVNASNVYAKGKADGDVLRTVRLVVHDDRTVDLYLKGSLVFSAGTWDNYDKSWNI